MTLPADPSRLSPSPEALATATPSTDQSGTGPEWHRLHPLTPWLRNWAGLLVLAGLVINNARDHLRDMIEFGRTTGLWWIVGGALLILAARATYNVLWWRRARFRIGTESVELIRGILSRQHRSLRLDQLEAIDIVHPLIPRIFGLAELKLETAGGYDSQLSLAYLTSAQAEQVRADILAHRPSTLRPADHQRVADTGKQAIAEVMRLVGPAPVRPSGTPTVPATTMSGSVEDGPSFPSTAGTNRPGSQLDVATAGITAHPPAPDTPFATPNNAPTPASLATPETTSLDSALTPDRLFRVPTNWTIWSYLRTWDPWIALVATVGVTALTIATQHLTTIFAYLPILAGFGRGLWNHLVAEMGFSGYASAEGIRLTHGLTTQVSQTIPASRVQAVMLRQRRWWRRPDWWRVTCNVAGYGMDNQKLTRTLLIPVADPPTAATAIGQIAPWAVADSVWPLIDHAMHTPGHDAQDRFVTTPQRARFFDPFAWRRQGYVLTDRALIIRGGWFARWVVVVAYDRIQGLSAEVGPWEARQHLADVAVYSTMGPIAPQVPHLDQNDATELIAALTPLIDQPADARARA
jgi:putative membrane protein